MSETARQRLAAILAIAAIAAWWHWRLPGEVDAAGAASRGWVELQPRYATPDKMLVRVTLDRSGATTVVIPAGSLYRSGRDGAQDMVAGETVRVVFTGGPTPQQHEVDQEVYCMQRRLRPPAVGEGFTWSPRGGGEETNPIQKLAACLEGKRDTTNVTDRQIAIWIVGENLLGKEAHDAERTFEDFLRQRLTEAAGDELDKTRGVLASGSFGDGPPIGADAARGYVEDFRRTQLAKLVEARLGAELHRARENAAPLLRGCGYDVDASPFFHPADAAPPPSKPPKPSAPRAPSGAPLVDAEVVPVRGWDTAPVRDAPGVDSRVARMMRAGALLQVSLGESQLTPVRAGKKHPDRWWRVYLSGEPIGWMHDDVLQSASTDGPRVACSRCLGSELCAKGCIDDQDASAE